MADFWIKIEKSTPDKPEIFEIAEILDIDPDAVLGKLIRVWAWLDSNSSDGHIKTVTKKLLDRVTTCEGFSDAMQSVGWLDDNSVPNFDRHLGESAKKRAKDSERKRKSRDISVSCHAKSVTESGLDKIREEKKETIGEKATRFTAPEKNIIAEYFKEKGAPVSEAEKFFYFYESKNWMVGRNKMKKWESAASGWISRNGAETNNAMENRFE